MANGRNTARKAEEVGGQKLSYAEARAIDSGNPAVLTLAEADAELKHLSILRKNHSDEQFLVRRTIGESPDKVRRLTQRTEAFESDITSHDTAAGLTIGNREIERADEVEALARRMEALPQRVSEIRRVTLGTFKRLELGLLLDLKFPAAAFLQGKAYRQTMLARSAGPRAMLNALGRLIGSYPDELKEARRDLTLSELQFVDFQHASGRRSSTRSTCTT